MERNWYEFWMILKEESDKVVLGDDQFENAKQIKKIQILFEKMSEIFLSNFSVEIISKMWVDFDNNRAEGDYKKAFKEFNSYLYYSSDRMNINRWLYCKMSINQAFDLVYNGLNSSRWYNECSKWVEDTHISILEKEVYDWFEINFESLYNKRIN